MITKVNTTSTIPAGFQYGTRLNPQQWILTTAEEPHEFETLNPVCFNRAPWDHSVPNISDLRVNTVCSYRRFLMECDTISKEEQQQLSLKAHERGLVLNRVTWSGNKSYHFVYQFPAEFATECYLYYKTIFTVINRDFFDGKADPQCSNPSRWTRAPNQYRVVNGKRVLQQAYYYHRELGHSIAARIIKRAKLLIQFKALLNEIRPVHRAKKAFDCASHPAVTDYLSHKYPRISGNGTSDSELFRALSVCYKYSDQETMHHVIAKAKSEQWTQNEIERKLTWLRNH